jgi:peptidoglycan/LPS O-acetylase OafA/YrhL
LLLLLEDSIWVPGGAMGLQNSAESSGYRRDIDGLRAVAVLAVILSHANFSEFSGGFVGVDVFFVLSGYLITRIIARALDTGRFSLSWFYERRIRRIIPAFTVMVAVTAAVAVILLPPDELIAFGQSALAAAFFSSNFFFAFTSTGYFAPPQQTLPLLHTWTLGVEEQFYIVWPLMLLVCHRLGFRIGRLVVILAAASLAYAEWSISKGHAAATFFLPQARAWELMFGAMLALGMMPAIKSRVVKEALAILGAAMLVFAIMRFSADTPFPGLWATIPCLGAALLIHTGQQRDTLISKLLGLWPCVFVGLISYSLYLWHWPILVFARRYLGHELTLGELMVALLCTVIIATASWRYVEEPFRHPSVPARRSQLAFAGGFAALAVIGCVSLMLVSSGGLPGRLNPQALRWFIATHQATDRLQGVGGSDSDVIVWGDSHADAFLPAAVMISKHYGLAPRQVRNGGCPPLIGAERVVGSRGFDDHDCAKLNIKALRQIERGHKPRVAILVARWSLYQAGMSKNLHHFLVDDQEQTLDAETSRRVLSRTLVRTLDALEALGIAVIVLGQPPDFPKDAGPCLLYNKDVGRCLKMPRQQADRQLSASRAILTGLVAAHRRAVYVGIDSILCDEEACWAGRDDRSLYYHDDNHLSVSGALLVGAALLQAPSLQRLFAPSSPKVRNLSTRVLIHLQ